MLIAQFLEASQEHEFLTTLSLTMRVNREEAAILMNLGK